MQKTNALLEESFDWLKQNYSRFRFFVERDLVWTVQMHLLDSIQERGLPYKVFNDYPMLSGKHRARSSDLAILNSLDEVEVAAEFKYEPSHKGVTIFLPQNSQLSSGELMACKKTSNEFRNLCVFGRQLLHTLCFLTRAVLSHTIRLIRTASG